MAASLADKYISVLTALKARQHLIEASLQASQSDATFDDIVLEVLRGEYHFYPLPNAVVIAHVVQQRRSRLYYVYIAGGDLQEILDFQPHLCQAAHDNGCVKLAMTGRKGWSKPLKKQGWSETAIYLEMDVVPETPDGQRQNN